MCRAPAPARAAARGPCAAAGRSAAAHAVRHPARAPAPRRARAPLLHSASEEAAPPAPPCRAAASPRAGVAAVDAPLAKVASPADRAAARAADTLVAALRVDTPLLGAPDADARRRLEERWNEAVSTSRHIAPADAADAADAARASHVRRGVARGQRVRVRRAPHAGPRAALAASCALAPEAEEADALTAAQKDLRASEMQRTSSSQYLLELRNSELLTKEEEALLATRAQVGMALELASERLQAQLGSAPTVEQLARHTGLSCEALRERLSHGRQAKRLMVEHNLRLVVSIARRYVGRGVPLGDLVQEGALGLVKGVEKFDPTKGYKFSTYSHWWIRQAISRALNDQSRTVRLPVHVNDALSRIRRVSDMLHEREGVAPSHGDVGSVLGLSAEKVRKILVASRHVGSMDGELRAASDKQSGRKSHTLADSVAAELQPLEDEYDGQFLLEDLNAVLNTLEPRERNVLRMHYGLAAGNQGRSMTLLDVGATYGISRERVRQIEDTAMRKLRSPRRSLTLLHHVMSGPQ